MPYLVVMDGVLKGRRFDLSKGTIRIGRVVGNEFVLENPSVSSGHAELVVDETGYTLIDRNSTNGTRVNGHRITSSPIFRNDVLMFGDLLVSFSGDDAPQRSEKAPVPAITPTAPAAPTSPAFLAAASASATVVIPPVPDDAPQSAATAPSSAPVKAEQAITDLAPTPVPEALPSPTRQMVTISSVTTGVRQSICPPDFKKRRDTRLIWGIVIILLLGLIVYAAREFISILHASS